MKNELKGKINTSFINCGLNDRDVSTLCNIFDKYADIHTVNIFGSRAKGNFRLGSDIDFSIMNEGVDQKTRMKLINDFEDSSLPYKVDIVYFPELTHPELIEHIKRAGKLFYQK